VRPVRQQPRAHEPHRVVQERVRPGGSRREAREALVADPDVPVVVVAAGLAALGQAGGGRGHHPAAGAGQAAHDGVRVVRVPVGDGAHAWHRPDPCLFGGGPGAVGVGRAFPRRPVGDL
jgi:hypothetical protein